MLAMDGADHRRLRGLVASAFRPSRVAAMRPPIERLADELLDDARRHGPDAAVDLRAGFAHAAPVRGHLRAPRHARRPAPRPPGRVRDPAAAVAVGPRRRKPVAASDVVTGTLRAARRRCHRPTRTGTSSRCSSTPSGRGLVSEAEALSSLFQLVVAGHDTTSSLIGNGVVALLDHPDQLGHTGARPGPRCRGPSRSCCASPPPVPHATFRVTTEPLELDGVRVPAGQQVLISLGAANRDPVARRRARPPRRHPTARPSPRVRPRAAPLPGRAARPPRGRGRLPTPARPVPRSAPRRPPRRSRLVPRRRPRATRPGPSPRRPRFRAHRTLSCVDDARGPGPAVTARPLP